MRAWTPRGLPDQASSLGVPAGVAEFGYAAGAAGALSMSIWDAYCPYLAGLASRLPLGCLYWGSAGQNVVTGPGDPKVAGIQQVIQAFQAA